MNITNERLLEMRNTFALRLPRRSDGRITPPVADAELVSALEELADLRAYKERTEAGLRDVCHAIALNNSRPGEKTHAAFYFGCVSMRMKLNDLWRDPQEEVKP